MSARRRLPHSWQPYLFGLLTSGIMSLLVSGLATWKAIGIAPDFLTRWVMAWSNAWPVAFAVLIVIAPAVQRLVRHLVEPPSAVSDGPPATGARAP